MKRLGLKISVSLLAFFIGMFCVWLFDLTDFPYFTKAARENASQIVVIEESTESLRPTRPDGKVGVSFIKFSSDNGSIVAQLEATNYNTQSAFYSDYADNLGNALGNPLPQFKINGIQQVSMYCGTGLREFELKAGESKIFQVSGLQINYYLENRKKDVQIGYWFSSTRNKEGKLIWSEKFSIPDLIMDQIKLEEKEAWEKFN